MGKAIVFGDLTVTNPLQQVTFSDGTPTAIRQYLNKLSVQVSDSKVEALTTFYQTLNNAGLWNEIRFLYPMFGSAADCAHGLVGADITIPTGATYDKGLNLVNASGGIGPKENGITLPQSSDNTDITYISCLGKNVSGMVNSLFAWQSDQQLSDPYCLRHRKTESTVGYVMDVKTLDVGNGAGAKNSCVVGTITFAAEHSNATFGYYFNGVLVDSETKTSGDPTVKAKYRNWGIDGKSTAPSADGGLTMVGVFNKSLTAQEISTLYNAVVALQNVLFA